MVTKGIILSIDFTGNTCVVRMPLFETAGNDQITGTAAISNTPGSFNGYKVGDVVLVAFEDGQMAKPVILGKLYLGVEAEKADPRGVINVENLSTDKSATLPADTKLAAEIDPNVPNTTTPYSSLSSVANELNSLNTDFGQLNRFVNNQFKSIIEDSDGNQSIIDQLSDRINAKVSKESQDVTEGFGWELTNKSWILNTYKNGDIIPIFKAYNGGVEITNNLKLVGYPVNNVTRYARVRCEFQNIVINTAAGVWLEVPPIYRKDKTTGEPIPDYTPENYENYKNGDPDKTLILTNYLFDAETMPPFDDGWWVWQIDYATTYVYDEATDSLVDGIMNVVVTPIWYGNDSRLDSKPGGISRGPSGKEAAIGKIARDAKAIAQGKSTNYYSNIMPTKADYPNLRVEDCWFDTSENWVIADTVVDGANPNGQFDTREKYNNYYLKNSDNSYTKIEPTTAGITPNSTVAYKCDTNVLKQCTGWSTQVDEDGNHLPIWTDISGELVANKLTANYINAMDITAKKITIIDKSDNNKKLFEADGINGNGSVQIANFTVKADKLYSGEHSTVDSTVNGVYLGADGLSIGSGFKVTAAGTPAVAGYTKSIEKKYCIVDFDVVPTPAPAWWDNWDNSNWQTTPPNRQDEKYIWEWTRTTSTKADKTDDIENIKVCITGAKGDPGSGGEPGRGVEEVNTYYSLSNTTSADGPATGDSNIVDPPAVNKWSLKPQAFDSDTYTGYEYWTVTRTVYSDATSVGVWGKPVKASMMDVDFINSLGITAKYLEVKENLNISGDGGLTATNATISGDLLATQLVLHDVQLFTKNETNRRAFTLSASAAVEDKKVRVTATITGVDSGTITDHELIKAAVTFSYTGKATGVGNNKPVSGLWTATVELVNGVSSNSVLTQPTWTINSFGIAIIVNVNVETATYISHTPVISYQATGDFVNYVGFFDDRYNLHTVTKLVDVQNATRYYLKTKEFKGFKNIADRDVGSGDNIGGWYIENFDIGQTEYTDSTMWLLVPTLKSDFTSIETAELSISSPNHDLLMRFLWQDNNTGDTPRFVYSHIFGTGHAEDEAAKAATLDQDYYWLAFRVTGLPKTYSLSKNADTGEYSLTSTKKKFLMRLLANAGVITNTDVQWNLRLSVTGSRDPV